MTGRVLEVWCFGQVAGRLVDDPAGLRFAYDEAWVSDGLPPLSQSLPLDGSFPLGASASFFGGLLPEGNPRRALARQLGVSEGNVFALLEALGGDTAGAISVFGAGEGSPEDPGGAGVAWLDEAALVTLIDELPTRPMHADDDGEWRLSLAGAQDKLPVVVGADGRVGLTRGRAPSNAILKTAIAQLDGTVANEAFCLALAGALGVPAARAVPRRVQGREFLLVERYDRESGAGGDTIRLHQEDFCQALGVPSERKYESEGGPGHADCIGLLRRTSRFPAVDLLAYLDLVAVNVVIGNHDAHAKNVSLLYGPGGAGIRLAPAYDLLSTEVYQRVRPMSRKMAMRLGGEYRPAYLRARHIDRFLQDGGFALPAGRRRLRVVAERAPAEARRVREQLEGDGWDAPVLAEIVELIDRRAQLLIDATAPG